MEVIVIYIHIADRSRAAEIHNDELVLCTLLSSVATGNFSCLCVYRPSSYLIPMQKCIHIAVHSESSVVAQCTTGTTKHA